MVAAIAGERGWGDTRESWIGKAALRLGFSYPRTRSIFYGRAKLSADEYIALCRAIEQLNESAKRRRETLNGLENYLGSAAGVAGEAQGSGRVDRGTAGAEGGAGGRVAGAAFIRPAR